MRNILRREGPAAVGRGICLRLGAMMVLAAVIAACGGGNAPATPSTGVLVAGNPDHPVTITFWSYNYGTAGAGGAGIQTLLDGFSKSYPNIHVVPKNVSNAVLNAEVQAAAAAGQPPDVTQLGLNASGLIAASLPYVPLDEVVKKAEYEATIDALVPSARGLGMYGGKRVEMPFNLGTPTLYLNADLFRRAGLDPNHPPTTWAEVRSAALRIQHNTGAGGIYVSNISGFDWLTQSIINSNGGYTVRGTSGHVDVGFDKKPAVDAIRMLQQLNTSGAMPNLGAETSVTNTPDLEAFLAGRLGMLLNATLAIRQLVTGARFQVASVAEPAFTNQRVHPVNSGAGLVMFSKDADKRAAAWTFIHYLSSHDAHEVLAKQVGYLPLRSDVAGDPTVVQTVPLMKPALQQLPSMTPWASWPGRQSGQAVTVFQNAVQEVEFQGAPADSTMHAAATRVRTMLASA